MKSYNYKYPPTIKYCEELKIKGKKRKMKGIDVEYINREIDNINWDFKGENTQYLTHTFHSYPARFIPQIPREFIRILNFTIKKPIFDPFCGCGTTLVEAKLAGKDSVGSDMNPLAVLITKVKVTPIEPKLLNTETKELLKNIKRVIVREKSKVRSLLDFTENIEVEGKKYYIPPLPERNVRTKFTPEIKRELAIIKSYIDEIKDQDIRDFCYVCFSSTIRTIISSRSRHKLDVFKIFSSKLNSMIKNMSQFFYKCDKSAKAIVCQRDARNLKLKIVENDPDIPFEDESFDLIITSPPYVNALDYYREHMYNMVWLGMNWKLFKKAEIGGHSHFIQNRFRLLSEYLADMIRSFNEMSRLLAFNKFCIVVIGSSTVEDELIETYKHLIKIGELVGLSFQKLVTRNIAVERKYTSKSIGKINEEQIIIFRKLKQAEISEAEIIDFVRNTLRNMKVKNKNLAKLKEAIDKVAEDCMFRPIIQFK